MNERPEHAAVRVRRLPGLPERRLAFALMRRGAIVWALVRVVLVGGALLSSGGRAPALAIHAQTVVLLLVIVAALGVLDARRRNEDRFLANLGVSERTIALLSITPGLMAELLLQVVH